MAAKKSKEYPHKWPDGTYHSMPWEDTKRAKATGVPNPPPGSYDPNLDSELGKSNRGLGDLLADIGGGTGDDPLGTLRARAQDDLAIGLGGIGQNRQRANEDYATGQGNINTGYARNLSDLLQARARGEADYGTNVAGLQRQYQNLGDAQAGAQRKAGALQGSGANLQAARKRAANEALDRAPIDTAYQRFMQDSATGQGRLGEDKDRNLADLLTAHARGDQDLTTQGEALGLSFNRQGTDWATQLERAKREAGEFGSDVLNAKVAQFIANNPGQRVPITPGAMPVSAPKAAPLSITAGPGIPGTITRRRRRKGGGTTETYSNTLSGP
jgi:hypothetical protein